MKKSFIIVFVFILLLLTVLFIYELNNAKKMNSKLQSENTFLTELNDKLLNNDNPIDQKEKDCLENAFSTSDSLKCSDTAIQEWENEIKKYLDLLKQTTTAEQYEHIKNNQDLWIQQNKSNEEIITEFIFNHSGTMYHQIASSYYVQEVKQRAQFLKSIYEIHNE